MNYRLLCIVSALLFTCHYAAAAELALERGDHICLVGNALGERLQHNNDWETLLYQRFPDYDLVVRNLCFPGDEPFNRLRSLNFGSPDDHLTHSRASVILFFFGLNESFAGEEGVAAFKADLVRLVEETKTKNYSGAGAPRMALVSPIAFENTGDPNLPDGNEHNARLALYTEAMRQAAEQTGVPFVDLFAPTKQLFDESGERLTLNGVHLNAAGYRALAPILDRGLFGAAGAPAEVDGLLKAEIDDKNFHWWHRYRAVNGYSIYGTRGEAGFDGTYRNRDVMERERAILDQMCANRDERIWQLAAGRDVSAGADDSNTLPFLTPKTNVPDDMRGNSKLGSLDYLPAAEQQKYFKLAPGYEISLVASEEQFPELAKPVALNFDGRGRLWVATMPSYPQWQPKTPMDDKLLILEDHDKDGRADECKVFAGGLHQPTGFEIGQGGVYIAEQPDILFLKDTDGDDRADVRVRQLFGFDSADSHHGLAAFEWGPDGGLYFQEGTFKQSQVESPYGLSRLSDAGVWRYEPRTAKFGVHASLAFANPWGHVFDRWGQNFIADASPGFNYWAAPITGRVDYPDKHAGGTRALNLDWGGSKSKREYPVFIEKRVRPTSGCEIVSSRHFPDEAQGNFLVNNVITDLAVLQHTVHEEGSGFGGKEITPLVLCEHGNFRPVDLQFGPDGALYIVDWHNALIGHLQHNLRDPNRDHSHGRIWRVTYAGRPLLVPPTIEGAPIDDLLALLTEYEDRTRYRARRELATRDTAEVIAAVKRWTAAIDPSDPDHEHQLLEALWVYQTHNVVNAELLSRLLEAKDHRARAAAVRVLSYWADRVEQPLELLYARINDPHPRVRLEAVRACSFIESLQAMAVALDVLNHEMDEFLDYTLDETLRALSQSLVGAAQELAHAHHAHDGQPADQPGAPRPILFLNKNRAIVDYQLARLSTSQLLAAERSVDDKIFEPVYQAILERPDAARQDREEALAALTTLRGTTAVAELLAAIAAADDPKRMMLSRTDTGSAVAPLTSLLLAQPADALAGHADALRKAMKAHGEATRAAAYAAMLTSGAGGEAWSMAEQSLASRRDYLIAVALVPDDGVRAGVRGHVIDCLDSSHTGAVRRAAIEALAHVPQRQAENFGLVAPLVESRDLRDAAVAALLAIPKEHRTADGAARVVRSLVAYAEATPAARRTSSEFLEAMHLADELMASLPIDEARSYRDRLREVVVRVVRIGTVNEEMRYDTPFFAAEAGRPVQLVLHNDDVMPHNLVITAPGMLRDVAREAAAMTAAIDRQGRQFVPRSPNVLFSTRMIEPRNQDILTFTAPTEPGEYPYVCTFPNHWMRMYGVMVVVPDLDAWLEKPLPPADPLGITRPLVKSWTLTDFDAELASTVEGRQTELAQRLFQEATCLACHKLRGEGGAVGPDLTDVFQRHKGDQRAVMREILEPSHLIDPKFALYNVLTVDGRLISGVITYQDAETITIVSNPEAPTPQVIARDDVEELVKSTASMMPKGLMDRFTHEEIMEILALLKGT